MAVRAVLLGQGNFLPLDQLVKGEEFQGSARAKDGIAGHCLSLSPRTESLSASQQLVEPVEQIP